MSVWKLVIILFVLGALVFAGINYFSSGKRSANNPTQVQNAPEVQDSSPAAAPSAEKNTIILNSNGFSPFSLTIKAGESIAWVNQSGKTATVNSDPHPTHTAYAALNLGSFDDGAKLSLTFDKAGTYGFHNHFNPSVKGIIIVE